MHASPCTRAALAALGLLAPVAAQLPNGSVFFNEHHGSTAFAAGSVRFSGTGLVAVAEDETVGSLGIGLDPRQCHVYLAISLGFDSAIVRVNTNGTGRTVVRYIDYPQSPPQGVTLDLVNERLYWFSGSGQTRVFSSRLDGSDVQPLLAYNAMVPAIAPWVLQVDPTNDAIHWYDPSYGFRRADLDGKNPTNVLAMTGAFAADIDVVNGSFYWTNFDTLWTAPIDGSSPPAVVLTDPEIFMPSTGKHLDVEPAMDLITWTVSGGRIHWTSLSSPGTIHETPTFQAVQPAGSLEVMPGPRVQTTLVSPSADVPKLDFDVCGLRPGGHISVFTVDVSGTPGSILFGALANAEGALALSTNDPVIRGVGTDLSVWSFDAQGELVGTRTAQRTPRRRGAEHSIQ